MALCTLCQTIPFTSLPSMPANMMGMHRVADNHAMPEIRWPSKKAEEPIELKAPVGFPWHESLDMLAESAKRGCPLCALVQAGVDIWLAHYREAEANYKGWVQFYKKHQPVPNGQRLWLTKRTGRDENNGDGFLVLARNPVLIHSAYILTGVNLSVDSGSELASRFPLRPIEQYSGSQGSLEVAASLVRSCLEKHDQCGRELTPLPSRVLDVSSGGDHIKLINCAPSMTGKYLCLSHCWGASETLKTTQESYEKRLSGIALSELPKTFLDTVIIARHLDIPYIWIDSLCILQEDKDDWARESGRMTEVYSNAYLVVAANHAKDGNGGCFQDRPSRPQAKVELLGMGEVVFQFVYLEDEAINGSEFPEEPLTERGWALQERLLARRVLHYNDRQIFFECRNGILGEDGCSHENRYCCDVRDLAKQCYPKREKSNWNLLLWSYGGRNLTKANDKLPAISGLAKLFSSGPDTRYVAGLWSDKLLEGLAWQSLGPRKPMSTTEYIGPTWSWASYAGIAATGLRGEWKEIAEVKDWHVELVHEESPFGQVKDAWINLHAPITKLIPGSEEFTAHEMTLKEIGRTPYPRFRTRYSDQDLGKVASLDHEEVRTSAGWRDMDLEVVLLHGHHDKDEEQEAEKIAPKDNDDAIKTGEGGEDFSYCYGLIVTRDGKDEKSPYKRVGWMFLEEEANKVIQDKESWKTVRLV